MDPNPSSSKADRKTVEKNRRNQMKSLYSQLSSLLPQQNSMKVVSLPDQLGEATNYIKRLQIDLEKMKRKKDRFTGVGSCISSTMGGLKLPHVEIHATGSAMEVALITGLDCQFMFSEIIRMFHEEGAEVLNASFSFQDDTILHTIHSKLEETPATEDEASRISEMLKKYVYSSVSQNCRSTSALDEINPIHNG